MTMGAPPERGPPFPTAGQSNVWDGGTGEGPREEGSALRGKGVGGWRLPGRRQVGVAGGRPAALQSRGSPIQPSQ